MFCAWILSIYLLNQYCMWEQEISHHDCCLNVGLLDEQYISSSCAREMDLRIQYLFHATHVQAKKRKTPTFFCSYENLFFPSFYAVQHIKVFLIWRNPHPVARIHEGSCVQCQPHCYVLFGIINGSELICQTEVAALVSFIRNSFWERSTGFSKHWFD